MESLLKELPFAGWIISIVILVLGGAASAYLLDAYRSKKRKEKTDEDDRLIKLLQTTVDELDKKVTKQDTDIQALTEEVRKVREENATLREVLQGRDKQTQEFHQKILDSIELAKQTHATVAKLGELFNPLNQNMTKLIEIISKHVDVIDHATFAQSSK